MQSEYSNAAGAVGFTVGDVVGDMLGCTVGKLVGVGGIMVMEVTLTFIFGASFTRVIVAPLIVVNVTFIFPGTLTDRTFKDGKVMDPMPASRTKRPA